jgi:ABC-2 type transport system ATP-binding protein
VLDVRGLHKAYGGRPVLRGVSFELRAGRILGVLGPNGAGKTTLLECVEGLRRIDAGDVRVLGRDLRADYKAVQRELGIQLQRTTLFATLTVSETLRLYATLYGRRDAAGGSYLRRFGLDACARTRVGQLSGGQYQRFSLCLATLNEPRVLFLDEPTTGLDPHARRTLWGVVRELRATGAAIVLTTHYLDEAEALCDEVLLLGGGRIVASGAPATLVAALDAERTLVLDPAPPDTTADVLACLDGRSAQIAGESVLVYGPDPHALVVDVLARLAAAGIRLANLQLRAPSLDDVFVRLTAAGADGAVEGERRDA